MNQNSTIRISKNSAYDYVNNIIYKKVSSIIEREYLGINQSCKYRPLQDYYYLIELLTYLKIRIDCYINSVECLKQDEIKKMIDDYACASKCLSCFNLPTKEIYEIFGLNIENTKGDYILKYTIILIEENYSKVTTKNLRVSNGYSLNVQNPDPDKYQYLYFKLDGEYITPLPNSYDFNEINCNREVVVAFKALSCLLPVPEDISITITNTTQTDISVSWNNAGGEYLVQLYKDNVVIQSLNTTNTYATFTELLPITEYQVRVIATNCAGSKTSIIDVQTQPYLVIVQVINGTSTVSGTNTVIFNSNFTIDFNSTIPNYLISFKINNIDIPISSLNITSNYFGNPQGGNYTINNIKSNKYVIIEYTQLNVCQYINITYSSDTITISV